MTSGEVPCGERMARVDSGEWTFSSYERCEPCSDGPLWWWVSSRQRCSGDEVESPSNDRGYKLAGMDEATVEVDDESAGGGGI